VWPGFGKQYALGSLFGRENLHFERDQVPWSHESDDEESDWDDDSDNDDDDDGYIACPHCGGTMLEAADYCPNCERWITREDLPDRRQPWWIIIVVLILVATIVVSILP
jgi:RNA polymerase subunit RPABC4/transcription elongation factor Spt4